MRYFLKIAVLGVIISCTANQPKSELETTIINLKTEDELIAYWQAIYETDQNYRGIDTVDSLDNLNFKKSVLLIKHHGYPSATKFGNPIARIPNMVFTHQRSNNVRKQYFPIFYDAFKNEVVDTFWFLHNVKGLHRDRFSRDRIRGRKLNVDDVPSLLKHLGAPEKQPITYDISNFEALFSSYFNEVRSITSSDQIGRWRNGKWSYHFYKMDDTIYAQKVNIDGSYAFPQKLKYDDSSKTYFYLEDIGFEDAFQLDENGDLLVTVDKRDLQKKVIYEEEVNEKGETVTVRKVQALERTLKYSIE